MNITLKKLVELMPTATMVLIARPDLKSHAATEIWIKFKHVGRYIFIDLEQPFPSRFEFHKLVGAGNALNCSDSKRDELQHDYDKGKIIEYLENSINYKSNMSDTIYKVIDILKYANDIIR